MDQSDTQDDILLSDDEPMVRHGLQLASYRADEIGEPYGEWAPPVNRVPPPKNNPTNRLKHREQ